MQENENVKHRVIESYNDKMKKSFQKDFGDLLLKYRANVHIKDRELLVLIGDFEHEFSMLDIV